MNIIPAIDLLNGVVVHGVAGQRNNYRPICSGLTSSPAPPGVMKALQKTFGLQTFYVADLDAIQHQQLDHRTISKFAQQDVSLMVDRGIRCGEDVEELIALGVDQVVVALETLSGLPMALELLRRFGSERLVVSVDLQNGRVLTPNDAWGQKTALCIAEQLLDVGYRRFIVLDLATVGMGEGVSTTAICADLRAAHRDVTLMTGGGVRGIDDMRQLHAIGVQSVLVATALHDGRLTVADVNTVQAWA